MVLRVLVAEDNLLVREGIVKLLKACPDMEVIGSCSTYDDLLAATASDEPDVVLTDIRMPPTGTDEGIRAAMALRTSHPKVGVVVLSQYAEPAYAIALLEDGSDGRGYLLKERVSDAAQIVHALEEVARGGSVIDPIVVDALVQSRLRSRRHRSTASRPESAKCSRRWPRAATTRVSRPRSSSPNERWRNTSIRSSPSWA